MWADFIASNRKTRIAGYNYLRDEPIYENAFVDRHMKLVLPDSLVLKPYHFREFKYWYDGQWLSAGDRACRPWIVAEWVEHPNTNMMVLESPVNSCISRYELMKIFGG